VHSQFRSFYTSKLVVLVAGCAAEQVFYGENTDGASNDMERATGLMSIIVDAVAMRPERIDLGDRITPQLCAIGEVLLVQGGGQFSSPDKRRFAAEFLGRAYLTAWTLVVQNRDGISTIAQTLVENKELYGDEVFDLLDSVALKPAELDFLNIRAWPEM
jgi:ATP-dependent Zn protease